MVLKPRILHKNGCLGLQSEYGLAWAFHQIDIWSKVATAHPIAVELQGIVIKITLLETPDA